MTNPLDAFLLGAADQHGHLYAYDEYEEQAGDFDD